ncbi:MAG: hypothetical protein U1G05_08255 [Kiritimatiellia bacterium]
MLKGAQIQIRAKLIETKPGGAEDILSAPQVLALSGQEAMITVGQELPVAPDGDLPKDLPAGLMTVETGVKLRITATWIGTSLCRGASGWRNWRNRRRGGADAEKGQLAVVSREATFNLVRPAGTPVVLKGLDGERLRVELFARVLPTDNAAPVYWQAFAALPEDPTPRRVRSSRRG